MGLTKKEWDNPQILDHIFHGLSSDGLISNTWAFGSVGTLNLISHSNVIKDDGIIVTPTAKGAELFLWGFGCGNYDLDHIFSNEFSSNIDGMPIQAQNSCLTKAAGCFAPQL